MEDVFKAMGDALNPNCQPKTDTRLIMSKSDSFDALSKAIDMIDDIEVRINLRDKLIDYLNSKY
jgi:hypothetical protein